MFYIKNIFYTVVLWGNLDEEFSVGFAVKWSVQLCWSVTVTQKAVLNTAMTVLWYTDIAYCWKILTAAGN